MIMYYMYVPKKKKIREAWKGSFVDSYFGNLENGEWIQVSFIKFWWLKSRNYITRIRYE